MTRRFYLPEAREPGQILSLRGEELHHLRQVLRLGVGDPVALFDGAGRGFSGKIVEAGTREARILVVSEEPETGESPLRLTLMPAVAKGEKLELVIQKATELGVSVFRPVTSARAEVRPVAERLEKRLKRWHRIALEACKQSGRSRLPVIEIPSDLPSVLSRPGGGLRLVLDPRGRSWDSGVRGEVRAATEAVLAVGPEGGWSGEELKTFRDRGFLPFRIGPRVLRAETAAIVSTALVQFLVGDLGTGGRRPQES